MNRLCLVLVALAFSAPEAANGMDLEGSLGRSAALTAAQGPFTIKGTVTIISKYTLSFGPGCVIEGEGASATIHVEGSLQLLGDPKKQVSIKNVSLWAWGKVIASNAIFTGTDGGRFKISTIPSQPFDAIPYQFSRCQFDRVHLLAGRGAKFTKCCFKNATFVTGGPEWGYGNVVSPLLESCEFRDSTLPTAHLVNAKSVSFRKCNFEATDVNLSAPKFNALCLFDQSSYESAREAIVKSVMRKSRLDFRPAKILKDEEPEREKPEK